MLRSLEINGYRLLNNFTADLGQLTVVVGANSTGKSTLLDCLQLISQLVEYPLREALGWHGGLASILTASPDIDQFTVAIMFDSFFPKPSAWQMLPGGESRNLAYQVQIMDQSFGQPIPIKESLGLLGGTHEGEPSILLLSTPDTCVVYDQGQKKLVSFDQGAASTKPEPAGAQGPTLRLAQMRFFNEYPVPSWARYLLSFSRLYPGFDVGKSSNLRLKPAEIKPETALAANGENLGTVLHELLTRYDYRDTADTLRDFLRAAYPSFEEITTETAYGTPARVLVRIREKGMKRPMELWDLSDGVLRFLCLTAALLPPQASLVAIDEPETGLHPKLLPIVGDLIKTAAEKGQILVTTHSPDLLNQFGLDDVAVIARENGQARWLRPGTRESLRKMLANVVSESLGDLHRTGELESL